MIFFLIGVGLFTIYLLLKARKDFKEIKEQTEYDFIKNEFDLVEDRMNPKLYAHRGLLFQRIQNFPQAYYDYIKALELIGEDKSKEYYELMEELNYNIRYVQKPLPWSKTGLKDLSNSYLSYFLITQFGYIRFKIFNKV